jgi:hypothetical protein
MLEKRELVSARRERGLPTSEVLPASNTTMLLLWNWLVGGDTSVFGHAVEERTSVS